MPRRHKFRLLCASFHSMVESFGIAVHVVRDATTRMQ